MLSFGAGACWEGLLVEAFLGGFFSPHECHLRGRVCEGILGWAAPVRRFLAAKCYLYPVLPCLFSGRTQGKPRKKQGFFVGTESLESLEREKAQKTRKSSQKKTRNAKNKNKESIGPLARFGVVSGDLLPRPFCRNVSEDFCCINFGGFSRGFSWRIFLGTFSPQK